MTMAPTSTELGNSGSSGAGGLSQVPESMTLDSIRAHCRATAPKKADKKKKLRQGMTV